jgi:hypothetical protein
MDRKKIAKNQSRKKKASDYITKALTDINKFNEYNKYTPSSDADPEQKRSIEENILKLSIRTIKKGIDAEINKKNEMEIAITDPSLTSEARNLYETRLILINKKLRELELAYSLAKNDLEIFYVTEKDDDSVDEDNYDKLHYIREQLLKQIEAHSTDLSELMTNVAISEALPSTSTDVLMQDDAMGQKRQNKNRVTRRRRIKKRRTRRRRRNKK